jgi:DNA mismatch repair protein MutH
MIEPPASRDELVARARELTGRTLGDIAGSLGLTLEGPTVRSKGKAGMVIERALGASAGSAAIPDFPDLGVELKTVPLDGRGKPREGTFVCSIDLAGLDEETWETSRCRGKLACVLWVPLVGDGAPPTRIVGEPLLWELADPAEATLRADWEDLVGRMAIGGIESVTAHDGELLQVRPKAAHGGVRTLAPSYDGEPIATVPRGFYLRPRFTEALLQCPGLRTT